ncbi:hypothetical protein KBT16_06565 [Nostoc sp. CCCryo 231-06]|nr:hypothetical protein [Nostoc sp. CCCryo 231-06]
MNSRTKMVRPQTIVLVIDYVFCKYESSGGKLFSKILIVDALFAYFPLRKFAPERSPGSFYFLIQPECVGEAHRSRSVS